MKKETSDWLMLFIFCLVLASGCVITYYIIISNIDSCTSNPLKYYADKISHEENFTYEYISFNIYNKKYDIIPIKSIQVDSTKSNNPISISNLK